MPKPLTLNPKPETRNPKPETRNRGGAIRPGGLARYPAREREFFIDNLLVQIHLIIEMIWWTGRASWKFEFLLPGSLISTFLKLSHVLMELIYKLGFNQNYYTFTLILLIEIVMCSKFS